MEVAGAAGVQSWGRTQTGGPPRSAMTKERETDRAGLQLVLSYSAAENPKAPMRKVPSPLAPFLLPVLPFSRMSSCSFWTHRLPC